MIDVLFDARWIGNHGIGRFARELQRLLPVLTPYHGRRRPSHPLDAILLGAALRRIGPRLFFSPGGNPPLGWPGTFVFTLLDLNLLCVPENSSAVKRAYYKHIIRPACHRAAYVLTVSEYSKQEICEWAGLDEEKVVNVSCAAGVLFTPFGRKHDPGYPYLLYVGNRKPHKNLSRLLQAYSLSRVYKEAKLVLSGQPDRYVLEDVRRLGMEGNVEYLDLPSDADLADAYRGALALVYPSFYEGFGLPPLEAMACGTPVLTSNVCSIPEVVGDAAITIDPLDTGAIADGIRRLVNDDSLRVALREKGLVRVNRFSWDETARKTWDVLKRAGARDSEGIMKNESVEF